MNKELTYNMIAKFRQDEKELINSLQVLYMIRERKKLTKSEIIRLAVLDAAKYLKVGDKKAPPKAKKKSLKRPIPPSIDLSLLLEKTSDPSEGFMPLQEIKKALGLQESSDKVVGDLLRSEGFQSKRWQISLFP